MTNVADEALSEKELTDAVAAVSKLPRENYPADWKIVKLGEIVDVQGGSQPPKSNFIFEPKDGYVRLLQIRDFGDKPVPTYVPKKMVTKFCTKDDIFIARYGASLGRIVRGMEGAYNVALAKVIFDRNEIDPGYMFHMLQTPYFQTPIHMISRSAQNGFNKGEIFSIEVPLAPLDQQKSIVAEIEKQFSRLGEAVANLKRVKANLKRYKAAVLKAAVEGRLVETEAELARREGRSYETGEQLLQRILETRRSQWQGKGKYKEPAAPDTTDLPELPEGWVWATVDSVCEQIVDCPHSTPRFQSEGLPCIDTTWMTVEGLAIERARYVDDATYETRITRLEPKPGDIVFAREGTIGTAVLVPERMKPCLGQRVMLLRSSKFYLNGLLRHVLHSETVKRQYRVQALGSTVAHINVGDVKAFKVPLPPLAEQHCIVVEVERRLSLLRETEAQVDANLQRAERLRQSILARAFSGDLLALDEGCAA